MCALSLFVCGRERESACVTGERCVGSLAGLVINPDEGGSGGIIVESGEWELTGCVVHGAAAEGGKGAEPGVLVRAGAVCDLHHCHVRSDGWCCAVKFERGARGCVRSCVLSSLQRGDVETGAGTCGLRDGVEVEDDRDGCVVSDNTWLPR